MGGAQIAIFKYIKHLRLSIFYKIFMMIINRQRNYYCHYLEIDLLFYLDIKSNMLKIVELR